MSRHLTPLLNRALLALALLPLAAASCQSPGSEAGFHYRSTAAWLDAHPRAEEADESQTWRSPAADLRLWALPNGVRLHLHEGREEWLMVVDGHGTLRVGPTGGGLVAAEALQVYPLAAGDVFLIPRGTAHAIEGSVTIQVLFSPPQPEDFDVVFPD